MTRPIYIFNRNEEMTLILQNLPGSFNQMSVPKRKKVLTQFAGQTIGSYNTFDPNIEESLDTGGALAYREGWINEKLNVGANLEFEAFANESTSGYITNEGRAVAVDKKGFYREFIIRVVKDTSDEFLFKRVEAEGSEYELIDEWLPKYEQVSTNLKTALGAILGPTRFEVGQIDDPYSVKPVKLKHMSVRQAVNELIKQFGGEVRYRVLMQNNRVIKRYVDVLKRRGTNTGRRFETGKDIIKVSRTLDSTQIKTALYGIGASDEHGNRLTFRDVVWEKAKGDPVDKPKDQEWVGDPKIMARWGAKGGSKHKYGGYDGQEEDAATLLLNTYNELISQSRLIENYEVDTVLLGDDVDLGDNVKTIVPEFNPPLLSDARIIELKENMNDDAQSKAVIGDFKSKIDLERRVQSVEKDRNEDKGRVDKTLENNKKEIQENKTAIDLAKERIAAAEERIEESFDGLGLIPGLVEAINKAGKDINDANKKLIGVENDLKNKIPIGGAAADLNNGTTQVLGKNLIVDGSTTITGTLGGSEAIFMDLTTRRLNAIDSTFENATLKGTFQANELLLKMGTFEDVVINQATVNEGTIVNATIQNADITGTLMGVKGIFEGEFRIRGVVREEIDGNIQHPEYNNWNIDAKMNGLEFTSRVHNGIYTKTYGIDPTKVYSENTGGRNFGGYELLGLGTDGYTELNALHGQHLVLGIKANGMDSSQTKVMAMNPNYTYIYNTLDVDKINMGNIRLYEDTADSRRFKIDTGTNKPSIWMDPVRENIYIRNRGSNLVTLYGSKSTTFHGSVSVEGDLDVKTGNVMRSNVWQASNSSYLRMQTSYKAEVLAVNSTTSYMPIKASKHETGTSLRGNKKNVEECTTDVLSWIENMGMYHYNVISDVDDTVGYFGVMVDETPDFIHSDDNDSIDLYAFSTFNSLGIKQLYNRVKNIETHLGL